VPDTDIANLAVFFGGFRQSTLDQHPNAYSSWVKTVAALGGLENCILNLCRGIGDSLLTRWQRLERILKCVSERKAKVHILGYSMGCHIVVRFAHELCAINTGSISFGDLYLVAPDPKYIRNDLDSTESAYDEAQRLWNTTDVPGNTFALRLRTLPIRLSCNVYLIYSKFDPVARWDANVETLVTQCAGQGLEWKEIKICGTATRDQLYVQLDPEKAQDEYWIHHQLFTNVQEPSNDV
jgi:hypothetical protein